LNQQMADMLGKSYRETFGLLGGEAMECKYSRLEGGCGGTVHCKTCTIRRSITHTMETGENLKEVPALLNRKNETIKYLISTFKENGIVRLVIHEAGVAA